MNRHPDTIDHLAGLLDNPSIAAIRQQRDKVVVATQACEDLLLGNALSSTLTPVERLVLASEQALISGVPILADEYRIRASQLDPASNITTSDNTAQSNPRLHAMLHFARALALQPAQSDRAALLELPAAGLSVDDTVLLAQLIGFVAYQLRLLAGIQAMAHTSEALSVPTARTDSTAEPFIHPANLPPPGKPVHRNGFTSETLQWQSWLPGLDPSTATPQQQKVLDISHPQARTMDFYLLLSRQPDVLLQRSQAFNSIMYAPGGLSRAEREIAATAVSCANGCVYCASVHAQRFEQLAKRNDVIAQLFDDPDTAGTNARERAIIQAALVLTRTPGKFGTPQIQAMRDANLSALEILDMLHVAALFAWANRLMLNLGQEVHPPST